jgi:hypothetical protein
MTNINYSEILHTLEKTSLFDIYRLSIALNALLEKPNKLLKIKQQLRVGMSISYFSSRSNKLVEAVISEIRQSTVYASDKSTGKQWSIPLYAINLANVNTDIYTQSPRSKLDRNQLHVGETVGFLGDNAQETYGVITQLNPKTASIITREGTRWRVSYSHLFKIMDAAPSQEFQQQRQMIDVTPK